MGNTKLTIVGVGALGSHLAQFLRNAPLSLQICDFDRVESKNVMSQFHFKQSQGRNKATALARGMQNLYGLKIEVNTNKICVDNVAQVLQGSNLVVDCTDNVAARNTLQTHCTQSGTALLHGALAADGQFGRIVWSEHGFTADAAGEGAVTCEDGEHLPFISITAGFLARAVQQYLADGTRAGYAVSPVSVVRTH